jgi:hypothetical protein
LIAVFFPLLLIATYLRPTAANRRTFALTSALILIYGYFAVFSGTAFWGGSRVMYPVEFVLILLLVMAIWSAGAVSRHVLEQVRLLPGAASPAMGRLSRYGPWVMALVVLGIGGYGSKMIMVRDSGTYLSFGSALASRGNLKEAIPHFEQAVLLCPEELQAKANLARAYLGTEQYGEATPLLREVLRAKPGKADSNYLLGAALAKSGSLDEGLKYIREALRLDPNHHDATQTLNTLLNGVDHERLLSSGP